MNVPPAGELIARGAEAIGLKLDAVQVEHLERHVALLLKWNKSINLTAIVDPAEVVEKHVIDSLAIVPFVPRGTLLDVGTGAGFPGIPVRIARPDVEVILVDSVQKKVAFLKAVLADLRLGGARAQALRLEGDPAAEGLPRVHAAVARAFAAPVAWLQLAGAYVLPAGVVLCMLGPRDEAPKEQGELVLEREVVYRLPVSQAQRRLVVYRQRG